MITRALTAPASVEYGTPPRIFNPLNSEFGFTLDVCASAHNHKCARYFTRDDDGLTRSWAGEVCWMNPPGYGVLGLYMWVGRAIRAAREEGSTVVALVPARVEQPWWREFVWDEERAAARPGVEIRSVHGRIRFDPPPGRKRGNAPFACVVLIFRPAAAAEA